MLSILRHLEDVGFENAPKVVGSGFSRDGRECVTYVPGETPHEPFAWHPDAAYGLGQLVRRVHESLSTWTPPHLAVYRPWFARELPGSSPVIGHCDAGPYNILADGGSPIALIDWEFAGPTDAVWELTHVVWMNAQLHKTAFSDPHLPLPDPSDRAVVAKAILDGYEWPSRLREVFVDDLIEYVIRSAAAKGAPRSGRSDAAESPRRSADLQRDVMWRARGANWILDNRPYLERTLR